jgi:nucleoid-associated protein YgaU
MGESRTPPAPTPAQPGNTAGFAAAPPPSTTTSAAEPTLPTGGPAASTAPTAPTGRGATIGTFTPPSNATPLSSAARQTEIAVTSGAVPAAGQDKPYVVAPDDSFWSISEKAYGNGAYYRALFQYNRDRYPNADDVRPGSVLDIPPLEVLKKQFPDLVADGNPVAAKPVPQPPVATGAATYVVQEGDTLFEIARKQLGKASRWTEVYELNRAVLGENLENLRPGVELRLK